jgi:hypothetical protein
LRAAFSPITLFVFDALVAFGVRQAAGCGGRTVEFGLLPAGFRCADRLAVSFQRAEILPAADVQNFIERAVNGLDAVICIQLAYFVADFVGVVASEAIAVIVRGHRARYQ